VEITKLMTVADACLALKVSRRTLYRMIADDVLPRPKKMGRFRQSYFSQTDFERHCRRALK
jgi:excisionase family DNA binding protein